VRVVECQNGDQNCGFEMKGWRCKSRAPRFFEMVYHKVRRCSFPFVCCLRFGTERWVGPSCQLRSLDTAHFPLPGELAFDFLAKIMIMKLDIEKRPSIQNSNSPHPLRLELSQNGQLGLEKKLSIQYHSYRTSFILCETHMQQKQP
jgi:hypothetical protein